MLETDYLVIGAGASAMAFVDELVAHTDVDIVIVDRRHAPGGHWLDAYPFVRLHQPSAYYGVNSLPLGRDRVQTTGPEAGFYERATGVEVVDYYQRLLDEVFLPSGRVRFLPMTNYQGTDSGRHVVTSTLTGAPTEINVRRRVVDASYVASEIPSRHRPTFTFDDDVPLVSPNDVVRLAGPASGFTVLGAGKTAMDVCTWLLEAGTNADNIGWVRPRDGWFVNRRVTQPFEQSAGMLEYQARLIDAIATEPDAPAVARQLETHGIFRRLDTTLEPDVFRGATLADGELERLREIEQVVRLGRVRHIATNEIHFDRGTIANDARRVIIDCTAQGLATSPAQPIFQPGRIVVQFTTLGVAPWSAAILGYVETLDIGDDDRNRLCPPVPRTGLIADYYHVLRAGFAAEAVRRSEPTIQAFAATARLNPARGIPSVLHEPHAVEHFNLMARSLEAASAVLERSTQEPES